MFGRHSKRSCRRVKALRAHFSTLRLTPPLVGISAFCFLMCSLSRILARMRRQGAASPIPEDGPLLDEISPRFRLR